jgi:hypothetical protein
MNTFINILNKYEFFIAWWKNLVRSTTFTNQLAVCVSWNF